MTIRHGSLPVAGIRHLVEADGYEVNEPVQLVRTQPADWRVSAAFLWDMGSWCPYGFDNPAFSDPEIVAMIRQHNAEIDSRTPVEVPGDE